MGDLSNSEAKTEQLELSNELKQRLRTAFITDEKSFSVGQREVEEMIASQRPLSEILTTLVRMIEAQAPGMVGSVLLLSADGNHIEHGAAPGLPDFYVKAIDGAPIGPKCGSCGTAMYRGERVVVSDVLTDPLWEDYRQLAAAAGLRACWSTPIMSSRGKVLGSFAMYYRQPQTPTGEEARLTEVATRLAAQAIEQHGAATPANPTAADVAH